MAEQSTATDHLPSLFCLRAVGAKVVRMSLLWLGLGMIVGVLSAPPGEGLGRIIAGAIAGMIVFPFVGAFLGLIGGQWRETLIGGICGLILGFSLGVAVGVPELLPTANVGLVGGALVGATVFSYLGYVRKGIAALSQ